MLATTFDSKRWRWQEAATWRHSASSSSLPASSTPSLCAASAGCRTNSSGSWSACRHHPPPKLCPCADRTTSNMEMQLERLAMVRLSNPENWKLQVFSRNPSQKDAPKAVQSRPLVLTLQAEKGLLLLERGVAFPFLLQAPRVACHPGKYFCCTLLFSRMPFRIHHCFNYTCTCQTLSSL